MWVSPFFPSATLSGVLGDRSKTDLWTHQQPCTWHFETIVESSLVSHFKVFISLIVCADVLWKLGSQPLFVMFCVPWLQNIPHLARKPRRLQRSWWAEPISEWRRLPHVLRKYLTVTCRPRFLNVWRHLER